MADTTANTHPYTLEVERNPWSDGAWQWAIRHHGKLSSLVWAFQRMHAVIRLPLDGGEPDHGGTIQTDGDS